MYGSVSPSCDIAARCVKPLHVLPVCLLLPKSSLAHLSQARSLHIASPQARRPLCRPGDLAVEDCQKIASESVVLLCMKTSSPERIAQGRPASMTGRPQPHNCRAHGPFPPCLFKRNKLSANLHKVKSSLVEGMTIKYPAVEYGANAISCDFVQRIVHSRASNSVHLPKCRGTPPMPRLRL